MNPKDIKITIPDSGLFNAGDLVMLKSGGPVMTVTKTHSFDGITCAWFKDKDLMVAVFSESSLKKTGQEVTK